MPITTASASTRVEKEDVYSHPGPDFWTYRPYSLLTTIISTILDV